MTAGTYVLSVHVNYCMRIPTIAISLIRVSPTRMTYVIAHVRGMT